VKSDEEELTLSDVMTNDNEDPASKTARKMDWEAFLATVDERAKVVLINLIEGRTMKEAARKLNCSISTINTMYRRLTLRILEFMGSDVHKDIQRLPSWKNNLLANRERLMCRDERRTT
jgi:DNA-directed RNA polymerase specialized sigma24 family protein